MKVASRSIQFEPDKTQLAVPFNLQNDRGVRLQSTENRAQIVDRRNLGSIDAVNRVSGHQTDVRQIGVLLGVTDHYHPGGHPEPDAISAFAAVTSTPRMPSFGTR